MSMFYDRKNTLVKVTFSHKAAGGHTWLNIKN